MNFYAFFLRSPPLEPLLRHEMMLLLVPFLWLCLVGFVVLFSYTPIPICYCHPYCLQPTIKSGNGQREEDNKYGAGVSATLFLLKNGTPFSPHFSFVFLQLFCDPKQGSELIGWFSELQLFSSGHAYRTQQNSYLRQFLS